MSNKTKLFVIGSTLAAAFGGLFIYGPSDQQVQATATKEGYTAKPTIPVKGDRPTIGNGTTFYPDGRAVKMTDSAITKKQAFEYLKFTMNKDAQPFNKSLLNIPISQAEYDLYLDFTYQYGIGAWSSSSMLKNLKVGKYKAACDSLLKYKYVAKRDCSIRKNGCYGVWTRQVERHAKCIGAQ
ncbi:glycoside hydrolase family protein [Acinetobacter seifertii]|uniref:Lysozyme n=1 Tax=Acinetobacter seifertii TaxID=1530123 RepID=A0A7H2U2A3_9GAMM|nr:glycoside hydrolase family protein [Acinetobacter seifertii]MBD1220221.1 glycoside hydrolase family protein [Acinetobacter seifertii]MBD1224928.1 glycoside hydrolase family protein [Acinetobacter seifertii]MBD1229798.1 glycoside hydrolase family protein [Acinetobacter seifertii]QNX10693.1 glycoside hydrolase family protein [Acinetobacter seifertii]QNX28003.1 glycoside hydrolase family protein [Acinetobacter seifertii]